jgi:hypothetical protein
VAEAEKRITDRFLEVLVAVLVETLMFQVHLELEVKDTLVLPK